ncbi:hypothetical protein BU26DRAFT_524166 [Trematosphaeria pertusa]|uniref:DUF7704 domain-containing protein n=1 Tax=Trematosphaeria pertusa TaxID=390896 RepID=A0A6A6HWJ0_9PLEO|nr:uncharacterized protein BU26DRAFT_524166 [Trematosphaeria pertusa]KAF2242565.1 hypothetical protein BU26DRAFT_524166 [Trematosphaeria pertusa]
MEQPLPCIPLPYRLLLLYIEPVFALNGSILCLFQPELFLHAFSPKLKYSHDSQLVFDQLAATYLLFAFNQAVVLRVAKDLRVWKAIVLGILLCDTVHLWAGWKVMGTEVFVRPWLWRIEDWVAISSLVIPMAMRAAFLREVGIEKGEGKAANGKVKALGRDK